MRNRIGRVRRRWRGVDQMKAGTQLDSALSWSLELKQGHVLAMLGQRWELCAASARIWPRSSLIWNQDWWASFMPNSWRLRLQLFKLFCVKLYSVENVFNTMVLQLYAKPSCFRNILKLFHVMAFPILMHLGRWVPGSGGTGGENKLLGSYGDL